VNAVLGLPLKPVKAVGMEQVRIAEREGLLEILNGDQLPLSSDSGVLRRRYERTEEPEAEPRIADTPSSISFTQSDPPLA